MLSSPFEMVSNAKNSSDTKFNFNFHYLNGVSQTEGRKKEDASSSYIYADVLPFGGMEVRINGTPILYQATWYNCTVGGRAYINTPKKGYFIKQWVFEKNYDYAQLEGRRPGQTEDARGKWSPDSVGSYPSLN